MLSKRLLTAAATALAAVLTTVSTSEATVLCKTKKGGLVIREKCKKKDVVVDSTLLGGLGLTGPAGPAGPGGPAGPAGPSGGGLTVVDATGEDVGIVYQIGSGYYGGTYTNVLREMDGSAGPEFFAFGVNPNGFVTYEDYYGYGLYQSADCSGAQFTYVSCEYGACDAPPMFTSLSISPELTATYSRIADRFTGDFYASNIVSSDSSTGATTACTQGGGTVIGAVTPCEWDASYSCARCCSPSPDTLGAPLNTLDLNPLNLTPPFKLHR